MSASAGLDAQLGVGEESTWGTGVTPDRFYEFVSEDVKQDIQVIESKGIRTGARVQRSDRWRQGSRAVGGPVTLEVLNKSFGLLLKHMFGTIQTTGPVSSLYTHTATPGTLTGKSLTMQIGRPDLAGTVQPFTYEGCKFPSWELTAKVDDALMLKLDVVAQEEKSPVSSPAGPSLAAAAFPSTAAMLVFVDGTISVAGSPFAVTEFSLKGDTGLKTDRRFIGSGLIKEQLEAAMRAYTGELKAEFNDTTAYGRFVNGTEAAVVLTFAVTIGSNTFQLVVTMNVRFDGQTPTVGDVSIVPESVPFKCTDTGSGPNTAITVAYVTTDSTP